MNTQVTLTLPDELYEHARRWAIITQRDLSETLTDALTIVLTPVYNLLGGGWTVDVPIGETRLTNVLDGASSAMDAAELILSWEGFTWSKRVYYKTSGPPPWLLNHWVQGSDAVDSTFILGVAEGCLFRVQTNKLWHKKGPFSE